MNAQLGLVMEIAGLQRINEIQQHQINACVEKFQQILALARERDQELHDAIVALFEQDIKEMEDAMGSDDVDDALRSHDSKTGSAAPKGCDIGFGEGADE